MWVLRVDAWMTASVVVFLMLLASEAGFRVGKRAADLTGATNTRVDDATAALFGLLLAFTFGSASARYDRRHWRMVDEATAIGDLSGVASVLDEPERSELKKELLEYVDVRIATTLVGKDAIAEAPLLERAQRLQQEMTATTARAVESKNTPSVHNALVTTLNSTTTAYASGRAALHDHVPPPIFMLLLASSVLVAFSLGRVRGVNRVRQPVPTAIFIVLVGLALYTTLDLEQPRSGIIRVPVTSLESVRASMQR